MTEFGIIWIAFLVISLFKNEKWSVAILILSAIFQSTAIINISGKGYTPFLISEVFIILKYIKKTPLFTNKIKLSRSYNLILFFTLYCFIITILSPLLFSGIKVFSPSEGLDTSYGIGGSRLILSSGNIIQMVYLIINVLTMYILLSIRSKNLYIFSFKITIISFIIFIIIGYWEYIAKTKEIWFPSDFFFNNEGYKLLNEFTTMGLHRYTSLFIEASFAGAFIAMIFWSAFVQKSKYFTLFSIFVFLALVLNLSGTGFVTFFIGGIVFLLFSSTKKKIGFVITAMLPLVFITTYYYDYINTFLELVLYKSQSESGIVRKAANDLGIHILKETYGIGAGLGSHATSSFFFYLLSNTGLIGTFVFFVYLSKILRFIKQQYDSEPRVNLKQIYLFNFYYIIILLVGQISSISYLTFPSFWIGIFLANLIPEKSTINK